MNNKNAFLNIVASSIFVLFFDWIFSGFVSIIVNADPLRNFKKDPNLFLISSVVIFFYEIFCVTEIEKLAKEIPLLKYGYGANKGISILGIILNVPVVIFMYWFFVRRLS